jgi:hypothetical protein
VGVGALTGREHEGLRSLLRPRRDSPSECPLLRTPAPTAQRRGARDTALDSMAAAFRRLGSRPDRDRLRRIRTAASRIAVKDTGATLPKRARPGSFRMSRTRAWTGASVEQPKSFTVQPTSALLGDRTSRGIEDPRLRGSIGEPRSSTGRVTSMHWVGRGSCLGE